MEEKHSDNIFRTYKLDYIGKYVFYEEDELITLRDDGQYIVDNLKEGNRFDYDGASYTFTKFGNISEGKTERDVNVEVVEDSNNVKINNETVHLDLIYKMDVKRLEDHVRVTTRISGKGGSISCLLYVNLKDGEEFINALNQVKENQMELAKPKK